MIDRLLAFSLPCTDFGLNRSCNACTFLLESKNWGGHENFQVWSMPAMDLHWPYSPVLPSPDKWFYTNPLWNTYYLKKKKQEIFFTCFQLSFHAPQTSNVSECKPGKKVLEILLAQDDRWVMPIDELMIPVGPAEMPLWLLSPLWAHMQRGLSPKVKIVVKGQIRQRTQCQGVRIIWQIADSASQLDSQDLWFMIC